MQFNILASSTTIGRNGKMCSARFAIFNILACCLCGSSRISIKLRSFLFGTKSRSTSLSAKKFISSFPSSSIVGSLILGDPSLRIWLCGPIGIVFPFFLQFFKVGIALPCSLTKYRIFAMFVGLFSKLMKI